LIFKQVKSEGIAHISYFIGSENEAVVIDPRRDCDIYLNFAKQNLMNIKYIFESHRNEDYVIGSKELAYFTGAKIYHGPKLPFKYGEVLKEDQEFTFGTLKLSTLYTPGHTDESVSFVLTDSTMNKKIPIMIFSGDALFAGDVGRIDFYGPKEAPRLAENLYDSIFNKILPLGDGVILWPGHGAGSVCGKSISDREYSTLGLERLSNPVLQKTKEDFIEFKVNEHHEYPPYFRKMEQYNLEGPPLLKIIPDPPALSPRKFQQYIKQGALVIDARKPPAFGGAHIKDSYNIWLNGIPVFAGWVLSYDKPILLILESGEQLETAVRYLIRLGYDNIEGYLCADTDSCGLKSWYIEDYPMSHSKMLTVQELKRKLNQGNNLTILDVRSDEEWKTSHIKGALHIYVGHLEKKLKEIPTNHPIVVICSIGNRASFGASILRRGGFKDIYPVLGGMIAWNKAENPKN
jgi:hydroxyacylglutathione hydrolase